MWQKLSKSYAKVTATTRMFLICAHILDPFKNLWSFRMWEKGMDINPEDETSCTMQYKEVFPKYVGNKHYANLQWMSIIEPEEIAGSNILPCAKAAGFG